MTVNERWRIELTEFLSTIISIQLNEPRIGEVRYLNILTWLRGFRVKIDFFFSFSFCLSISKRDLDTKKTPSNMDVCPESLGAMLEYWYIERGLFASVDISGNLNWFCSTEQTADQGLHACCMENTQSKRSLAKRWCIYRAKSCLFPPVF